MEIKYSILWKVVREKLTQGICISSKTQKMNRYWDKDGPPEDAVCGIDTTCGIVVWDSYSGCCVKSGLDQGKDGNK